MSKTELISEQTPKDQLYYLWIQKHQELLEWKVKNAGIDPRTRAPYNNYRKAVLGLRAGVINVSTANRYLVSAGEGPSVYASHPAVIEDWQHLAKEFPELDRHFLDQAWEAILETKQSFPTYLENLTRYLLAKGLNGQEHRLTWAVEQLEQFLPDIETLYLSFPNLEEGQSLPYRPAFDITVLDQIIQFSRIASIYGQDIALVKDYFTSALENLDLSNVSCELAVRILNYLAKTSSSPAETLHFVKTSLLKTEGVSDHGVTRNQILIEAIEAELTIGDIEGALIYAEQITDPGDLTEAAFKLVYWALPQNKQEGIRGLYPRYLHLSDPEVPYKAVVQDWNGQWYLAADLLLLRKDLSHFCEPEIVSYLSGPHDAKPTCLPYSHDLSKMASDQAETIRGVFQKNIRAKLAQLKSGKLEIFEQVKLLEDMLKL